MTSAKTTVFQAGPTDQWSRFKLDIPGLPPAAKQFLKAPLAMNGMELSLNCMAKGHAMPFVHRHRENEELYVFLSGQGEFQADGQLLPITAGTCVRCTPEVRRAWRNTGDEELIFIVIQAPDQPMASANVTDGEVVEEPLLWA